MAFGLRLSTGSKNLDRWTVELPTWKAQTSQDIKELIVCSLKVGTLDEKITQVLKYSLSRQELELAVFSVL